MWKKTVDFKSLKGLQIELEFEPKDIVKCAVFSECSSKPEKDALIVRGQ